jgi:hypothetical protein
MSSPLPAGSSERKATALTHGHSARGRWSPTYYSWAGMIQRCTNPARINWQDYGGRGIHVCERWRNFAAFLADMGERPAGTSLERNDPQGHYEPGNCCWATRRQQARNRRSTKLTADDVAAIRSGLNDGQPWRSLARRFGVSKTLIGHIKKGTTWPQD